MRSTSAAAACARADALSPVSRSYAASRNCRLELELAKKLSKPIVIVNAGDGSFDPSKKETYAAFEPRDAAAEPEQHPSEWLSKAVGKKLWHDFRTPAAATSSLVNLFRELHMVMRDKLHAACSRPDASLDLVDALLAAHPEAARAKDKSGDLPLHVACASNAPIAIVRALLAVHPEAVSEAGNYGTRVLDAACSKGKDASLDLVAALLAARPEAACAKDKSGDLPLHVACASNAPIAIVLAVLTAHPAAVSEAGKNGNLTLHAACAKGKDASLDLVAALLAARPEAARAKDK